MGCYLVDVCGRRLLQALSQEANIQSDPYRCPDTSVLRNLADIRDANRLNQFESDHFFARLVELHESPMRGSFDSDHLRHIHKYVFQDVYAWAREFRCQRAAHYLGEISALPGRTG